MRETLKEGFARRLREAINQQTGKTISGIAIRCAIPKSVMFRYLKPNDPQMPGSRNLVNLCLELHVSADWLLFGEERP